MGIIARQAVWNTVFTYVGTALGFINVVLLYPKVLSADQFGLTRLLVSVAAMAAMVAQLGSENTIVRYFPYFRDPLRGHRGVLGMVLLFGSVASGVAMLVLVWMHGYLSEVFSDRNALYARYGLLVLPLVLSEVFFILLRSYSRSLRRTVQPTVIREFQLRLMQLVLIGVQWWWPMPFVWFLTLYVGLFLIGTLSLAWDLLRAGEFVLAWQHRWLPKRLRKSMVAYSGFTLSSGLAGMALGNLDQLMIGALLGDGLRYVAHYAVGFYFGSVIAVPARSLGQVAVPLLAEAWKKKDLAAIQDLYCRSSILQVLISGFLLLELWSCLDGLYHFLPEEYGYSASVAVIIGAGYFLTSATGLSTGILSMSRAYRLDAWSSLVLLLISIIGNFLFVGRMGVQGAAWATLLALVLVNTYRVVYLQRRYGLWPFDRSTLKVVVLLLALAGINVFLPKLGHPVWDLVFRAGFHAVVFWPLAYRWGLLTELQVLWARIGNRK